ncbi:hypothetical protein LEL_00091 [Akanthomyces lecanii RCEF 1005]|uniref:Uncharacterized protein n=1 Tax=Akanthomyces lecanii RCEF 1005 TaxID=1081108 RepID=A0A162KKT2_CORDF|nr:hypothetical protein LEL_00091 [Akanthomyces lecanii RCEF 1005]
MSNDALYDSNFIDPALLSVEYSPAQADEFTTSEFAAENISYSTPAMMHQ